MTDSTSRREFLRRSAAFSVFGAGAPLAMQLAAAGSAAAADATDYKALVCLFLMGGQDSNNLILATDDGSWSRYTSARSSGADSIALRSKDLPEPPLPDNGRRRSPEDWAGVVSFTTRTRHTIPDSGGGARPFAVHPYLAPVLPIYRANRLAMLANVGMLLRPTSKSQFFSGTHPLPAALGSHNDQQSAWLSGGIDGAQLGWGGRMADLYKAHNGNAAVFTSISAAGNTVFLAGNEVNQYHINLGTEVVAGVERARPAVTVAPLGFGSSTAEAIYNEVLTTAPSASTSNFGKDYVNAVARSINAATTLNNAVAGQSLIPAPPAFFDPTENNDNAGNPWTNQLRMVAQMIAAAPSMGLKRQVFFLCVDAHDTHSDQNLREVVNVSRLAQAMVYFDEVLGALDMRSKVTTFTAADFSRGFTTNGNGTDHAWGGHHMIMGGAVNGGDMYGVYPQLGIDKGLFDNPDFAGNNIIPTTSVDQYAGALGRWFGLTYAEIEQIFPNLVHFGGETSLPRFMNMT